MECFDEFADGALPPDCPTRLNALELVHEAAERSAALRQFLDHWFPAPNSGSVVRVPEAKARVESKLDDLVLAIRDLRNRQLRSSLERDRQIRESETNDYQALLQLASSNYQHYLQKRKHVNLSYATELFQSPVISPSEAEDTFHAAHFDMRSHQEVNLERLIHHRDAMHLSMAEMMKREVTNLEEQFSDLTLLRERRAYALEDTTTRMKLQVIRNTEAIESYDLTIQELQSLNTTASPEAKAQALAAMHLKFLEILEGIIPEDSQIQKSQSLNDTTMQCGVDQSKAALKDVQESLSSLSFAMQSDNETDSEIYLKTCKDLNLLKVYDGCVTPPSGGAILKHSEKDDNHVLMRQDILESLFEIHQLEDKIEHDEHKAQLTTFQNHRAMSQEMLEHSFITTSLEAPLLAHQDLHDVSKLQRLATLWRDSSRERSLVNRTRDLATIERIEHRIKEAEGNFSIASKVARDMQTLQARLQVGADIKQESIYRE